MTDAAPDVTIAQGVLRGTIDHGVPAYLGIPYAAPPWNEHRFQTPGPAPTWEGTRDAGTYGPTVPHPDWPEFGRAVLPEEHIPGEEVLNLNVWTPDPAAAGLPVFVWLHGGGFTNGSGAIPSYRGSAFARDGVIAVTLNYRLHAEGFLLLEDGTANLGLLDQIAALEWVRDTIAAFGGDPALVTVGGASAGAMSIMALLAAPRARGLFRGAVVQSGAGENALTRETAGKVTALVAELLGVQPTRAALAEVPAEAVVAAADAVAGKARMGELAWDDLPLRGLAFAPAIDGDLVPMHPRDAVATGVGDEVPMLIGTTNEEFRLLTLPAGVLDAVDETMAAGALVPYGVDGAEALEVFAAAGDLPGDRMTAAIGDWAFRMPAIRVAEQRSARGAATWMYRGDYKSKACDGRLGAAHSSDLPFVFDTLDASDAVAILGPDAPQSVADATHAAWVAFVKDLDPGWPAYDPARRATCVFDADRTETVDDPQADWRMFWERGA